MGKRNRTEERPEISHREFLTDSRVHASLAFRRLLQCPIRDSRAATKTGTLTPLGSHGRRPEAKRSSARVAQSPST
jgi:hypothetical protein